MGQIVIPGDVLGLHDGIGRGTFDPNSEAPADLNSRRSTEVKALPEVLQRIAERGIKLVTSNELLALDTNVGLR